MKKKEKQHMVIFCTVVVVLFVMVVDCDVLRSVKYKQLMSCIGRFAVELNEINELWFVVEVCNE